MSSARRARFAVPAAYFFWRSTRHTSCDDSAKVSYYGSYLGDRFGGGIGRRVGVDDSGSRRLGDTGVVRIQLFSESSENLRKWATASHWAEATRIHKAAYFTRTENLVQEQVVETIREHYAAAVPRYPASPPIEAALFRCDDANRLEELCGSITVTMIPLVVRGPFDERTEPCIVDFANKRLGGGWLSYGMVQEEKMFIERFDYGALCAKSLADMPDPVKEPLASPFSMKENEAWVLRGGAQWAHIGWYGRTPKDGMNKFNLLDPSDDVGSAPTVVAIDAIKADFSTYERSHLTMMLTKAYTGFVAAKLDTDVGGASVIATGSWGCGAFYNNERVMFVIQALAANLAGVQLTHHTLGDGYPLSEAFAFLELALLQKWTISEALDKLVELCATDPLWKSKFRPRKDANAGKKSPEAAAKL